MSDSEKEEVLLEQEEKVSEVAKKGGRAKQQEEPERDGRQEGIDAAQDDEDEREENREARRQKEAVKSDSSKRILASVKTTEDHEEKFSLEKKEVWFQGKAKGTMTALKGHFTRVLKGLKEEIQESEKLMRKIETGATEDGSSPRNPRFELARRKNELVRRRQQLEERYDQIFIFDVENMTADEEDFENSSTGLLQKSLMSIQEEVETVMDKILSLDSVLAMEEETARSVEGARSIVSSRSGRSGSWRDQRTEKLEDSIHQLVEKLDEKLTAREKPAASRMKLEQIAIPTFSGKISEWNNFWMLFRNNVHDRNMDGISKFNYLLKYLSGEAKELATRYRISESNYDKVIKLLSDRYAEPEEMSIHLSQELLQIRASSADIRDQRRAWNQVVGLAEQLEECGEILDSHVLLPMILDKFNDKIRSHYLKKKLEGGQRWEWRSMRDCIEEYIYRMEKIQRSMIRQDNQEESKKEERSNDSGCHFCHKSHLSENCRTVALYNDRWRLWKADGRCTKCGRKGHAKDRCRSMIACEFCKRDHHVALCGERILEKLEKNKTVNVGRETNKDLPTETASQPSNKAIWDTTVPAWKPTGGNATPLGPPKVQNRKETTAHIGATATPTFLLSGVARMRGSNQTGQLEEVPVLFDNGSTVSFIEAKLAEKLKLVETRVAVFTMNTVSDQNVRMELPVVEATLVDSKGKEHKVELYKKQNLTGMLRSPQLDMRDRQFLQKRRLLQSPSDVGYRGCDETKVLIGMNHYHRFVSTKKILTLPSGLKGVQTVFGLILYGSVTMGHKDILTGERSKEDSSYFCTSEEADVDRKMAEWLDLEKKGIEEYNGSSQVEKRAREERNMVDFRKSVVRRKEGYFVRLLWKENLPDMSDNKNLSYGRLRGVLHQYKGNDYVLQAYHKNFQEQLEKGIIECVDRSQAPKGKVYYLPHQPVLTPQKDTTKVRIVFDASAHVKGSLSLNQALDAGPSLIPDVTGVLMRWRISPIVVLCDVEKAFLQVHLQEEDRDATRFLWVKDENLPLSWDNVMEFRYTRVTFGIICSPFLLSATINYHLEESEMDARLVDSIKRNIYVDNLLISAGTVDDARKKCVQIKEEFKKIPMNLREFMSNKEECLVDLHEMDVSTNKSPKILGITWDTEKDNLILKCHVKGRTELTKRKISQQVAEIFDPLGLLSPITLPGKVFLQSIWKSGVGWDEKLKPSVVREWEEIMSRMEVQMNIPRSYQLEVGKKRLIVCCDASKLAMHSCAYIVSGGAATLVYAKTKLQSYRSPFTIPKMELVAVAMGCRMVKHIVEQVMEEVKIDDVIVLTDSNIALGWIAKKQKDKEGVLVVNRKKEMAMIVEYLAAKKIEVFFGYINTKCNPADHGTRGLDNTAFIQSSWWRGAEFFCLETDKWPSDTKLFQMPRQEDCEEVHYCRPISEESEEVFDWTKYNSWQKMKRIAVYVLMFIQRCFKSSTDETRGKLEKKIPELTGFHNEEELSSSNLDRAERLLLRSAQKLKKESDGEKKRRLNLNVMKGEDGIERCIGRMKKSDMPEDAKTPIYISDDSPIISMLIHYYHGRFHRGTSSTMAEIRRKYWIPRLRQKVKSITTQCVTCQRLNNLSYYYPNATDLPPSRVCRSRPFQHCGLDYYGPLQYVEDKEEKKAYGCVFTCFSTRLLHLEIATDLTTHSFVNCIRRFTSRRGIPESITSDNAPTFLLGEEVLRQAFQNRIQSKEVQQYSQEQGIRWKFITPHAPWMGGVYERLIKEIKKCMQKVVGRTRLSLDQLHTVTVEIETILNSRPLTYQGEDFEAGKLLRPIDFVQRDFRVTLPLEGLRFNQDEEEYLTAEERVKLKTRREAEEALQSSYRLTQQFWKLWQDEYLSALREQHLSQLKGRRGVKIPKVGDVVLLREPNVNRNQWKLARVVGVPNGKNIREASVKTSNGRIVRRPVNLLIPLELPEVPRGESALQELQVLQEFQVMSGAKTKLKGGYHLRQRPKIDYDEEEHEPLVNYENVSFCLISSHSSHAQVFQVLANDDSFRFDMSDVMREQMTDECETTNDRTRDFLLALYQDVIDAEKELRDLQQRVTLFPGVSDFSVHRHVERANAQLLWDGICSALGRRTGLVAVWERAQKTYRKELKLLKSERAITGITAVSCEELQMMAGRMKVVQSQYDEQAENRVFMADWMKEVSTQLSQISLAVTRVPLSDVLEVTGTSKPGDLVEPMETAYVVSSKEPEAERANVFTISEISGVSESREPVVQMETAPSLVRESAAKGGCILDNIEEELLQLDYEESSPEPEDRDDVVEVFPGIKEAHLSLKIDVGEVTRKVRVDKTGSEKIGTRWEANSQQPPLSLKERISFPGITAGDNTDSRAVRAQIEDVQKKLRVMEELHPNWRQRASIRPVRGGNTKDGCRLCYGTSIRNDHGEEGCGSFRFGKDRVLRVLNLSKCLRCLSASTSCQCTGMACEHCGSSQHHHALCSSIDGYLRLRDELDGLRRQYRRVGQCGDSVKKSRFD